MRVGAVDCGTNSIRLLVADVDDAGGEVAATEVLRRMEIVRLGAGIDATGLIAPEALARTLAACRDYAAECDRLGVERVRFAATSASRDARNADEFVAGVVEAFAPRPVRPEVITGHQEARLSFTGATAGLAGRAAGPYVVVDLGGGSTEFVRGTGDVEASISVDVGCVRLYERALAAGPGGSGDGRPGPEGVAALLRDVDAALDDVARAVDLTGVATLVGLAGTVTTVAAHALGLPAYDRDAIHGSVQTPAATLAACRDLAGMSTAQRAALGFMHPGRVDVIAAGALVWARIVERVADASPGVVVLVSEHDILDGLAVSLAGTPDGSEAGGRGIVGA
ncbi:Ppx/GppA phosphatase family protein [Agilicoccus flavus]|uniref:Ppx/GppA phosphatase family protein n=1 Tax=Agilicoccus flavus TaxID=2775968 RepID=UPI001CF61E6D|nr:Ppx/GppA phosphatase family protein [Agilicoccus flavus]